ncbi:MAG: sel1 repeat family protein [Pseudomonadales bacterium]|nr:sel1 repeat family protein [Pseudomonadales bacterium]
MSIHVAPLLLSLCSALLLSACAATGGNDTSKTQTQGALDANGTNDTDAYLALPDFAEQLGYMTSLETRVLALRADEPLAMGALGSALIERNPSSLTGHHALTTFYQHLDAAEAVETHANAFEMQRQIILASGDGSEQQPYRVTSRADAVLTFSQDGRTMVGGIYQSNGPTPLQLLLLYRENATSPVRSRYFDLSALASAVGADDAADTENPWETLRILADSNDSAARAAIGTYLAGQRRYESAAGWLEMASREPNLLAHTLLARIYWYQSGVIDKAPSGDSTPQMTAEELVRKAIENHVKAIDLGSTESMYTLGRWLLEDTHTKPSSGNDDPRLSTENKQEQALALLQQAGELGHAESYIYLASQYQRGTKLPKSDDLANRYFARAADLRNPKAVISYARYIAGSEQRESQTRLMPLLRELADANNPEAMVVIGNLYAKGIEVRRSARQAVRWYKKAVDQVQASHHGNAAIVNEVAWTLAVSDQRGLQQPDYAQAIMDEMMRSNKQVQTHPEYLDTWAATYAANGNFPKAIELQKRALYFARTQERSDVIDILQTHLESFEAGANITDNIP